jgi:hypothetical protein
MSSTRRIGLRSTTTKYPREWSISWTAARLVYDALIGKAVEIAVLYDGDEARRVLIQLIDKHLADY